MKRRAQMALGVALGPAAAVVAAGGAQAQGLELPTGRLRFGFELGNAAFVSRDPATGELQGINIDLSRALAARLGVPLELVTYETQAQTTEGLRAGAFDVTHQAIDSEIAGQLDFAPVLLEVENTYLVPPGSPIRRVADVDRPGVRVAVVTGAAPDVYLTQALRQATVVRAAGAVAGVPNAFALVRDGQADAFASNRQMLLVLAAQLPGSRVLDERFHVVQRALAVPKGRPALLAAVSAFSREALATGLVRQVIARSGVPGIVAAGGGAQLPRTGAPLPGGAAAAAGATAPFVRLVPFAVTAAVPAAAAVALAGVGVLLRRARRQAQREVVDRE